MNTQHYISTEWINTFIVWNYSQLPALKRYMTLIESWVKCYLIFCTVSFDNFRLVSCHTQGIIYMGIYCGGVIAEISFVSHTVQFGISDPTCLCSSTDWHISRWYLAIHHHQNTMLMFWTRELECTWTVIITEVNTVQGRNKASSFSCPVIAAQKNRRLLITRP